MSMSRLFGVGVALACSLALSVGAPRGPVGAPRGDEKPSSYVFGKPPVNARGIKGMADLRGKPVLIDFWGTH